MHRLASGDLFCWLSKLAKRFSSSLAVACSLGGPGLTEGAVAGSEKEEKGSNFCNGGGEK